MRDLILDFRQGGGSVPEVPFGIVRIWGTEVRPNATSLVLTTETTLKLSEGKATLANAQTSGTGPLYEWAYIIQVEPFCGRNYRFYVAIPDGTGPINLVDLPKLNPITGEGFYLDIEEWEALYGDLPNRVDALEASQVVQDTAITDLEARPIGNTTMRVDTTVGTRVLITDGTAERMVSGDTGWRAIQSWGTDGVLSGAPILANGAYTPRVGYAGGLYYRRVMDMVYFRITSVVTTGNDQQFPIPGGFNGGGAPWPAGFFRAGSTTPRQYLSGGSVLYSSIPTATNIDANYAAEGSWLTSNAWPSSLPGTPA